MSSLLYLAFISMDSLPEDQKLVCSQGLIKGASGCQLAAFRCATCCDRRAGDPARSFLCGPACDKQLVLHANWQYHELGNSGSLVSVMDNAAASCFRALWCFPSDEVASIREIPDALRLPSVEVSKPGKAHRHLQQGHCSLHLGLGCFAITVEPLDRAHVLCSPWRWMSRWRRCWETRSTASENCCSTPLYAPSCTAVPMCSA